MNINIKYGLINKHKGPINYHKFKLIGQLETLKRKGEEDSRVGNKAKRRSCFFARHVSQNRDMKNNVAHCGDFLFNFISIDIYIDCNIKKKINYSYEHKSEQYLITNLI